MNNKELKDILKDYINIKEYLNNLTEEMKFRTNEFIKNHYKRKNIKYPYQFCQDNEKEIREQML